MPRTFAEELASILEREGKTGPTALRERLALQGLEVTVAACSRWLTGEVTPSKTAIYSIAESFALDGDDRLRLYDLACGPRAA